MIVLAITLICAGMFLFGLVITVSNEGNYGTQAGGTSMCLTTGIVLLAVLIFHLDNNPRTYIRVTKLERYNTQFIYKTNIENFSIITDSMLYVPGDTIWLNKGNRK